MRPPILGNEVMTKFVIPLGGVEIIRKWETSIENLRGLVWPVSVLHFDLKVSLLCASIDLIPVTILRALLLPEHASSLGTARESAVILPW